MFGQNWCSGLAFSPLSHLPSFPLSLLTVSINKWKVKEVDCPLCLWEREKSTVLFGLYFASLVDCLDPTCSSHGACHHGECHCNPGWGGINCEILKSTCPEQCSSHGTFNTESGTCICEANWTGPDCSVGQKMSLFYSFSWLKKGITVKLRIQIPLLLLWRGAAKSVFCQHEQLSHIDI